MSQHYRWHMSCFTMMPLHNNNPELIFRIYAKFALEYEEWEN